VAKSGGKCRRDAGATGGPDDRYLIGMTLRGSWRRVNGKRLET
jgi:hypothetical protein